MSSLQEKVSIITGASSGIGRAAALLFARHGAKLVVNARQSSGLDQLVTEIAATGGEAVAVAGDVCHEETAARLVETANRRFGGLDIALNNAGTLGAMGPVPEQALDAWRNTLDTNLTSAFLGAKYQIPAMQARGGGSLLFTSTFVGSLVGMPGMAAYGAAKAGVLGLMRVLAAEYGPQKIRVNALICGGTDTPMGRSFLKTPEVLAFVESLHALKRIAQPEEIAEAALFLASNASGFITGSALQIDGGFSITRT